MKERLATNIPHTLDNTREYDPSMLTANLPNKTQSSSNNASSSTTAVPNAQIPDEEVLNDIATDPFASYFDPAPDNDEPVVPKVLITTSQKATRVTYEFCEELAAVFPDSEFRRRPKGQGFEMGRIAGWAAKRGYGSLMVVNEDRKTPSTVLITQRRTDVHMAQMP